MIPKILSNLSLGNILCSITRVCPLQLNPIWRSLPLVVMMRRKIICFILVRHLNLKKIQTFKLKRVMLKTLLNKNQVRQSNVSGIETRKRRTKKLDKIQIQMKIQFKNLKKFKIKRKQSLILNLLKMLFQTHFLTSKIPVKMRVCQTTKLEDITQFMQVKFFLIDM